MHVDKIEELERRFQELEALLSDPAVISNQAEFRKFSREHSDLLPLVEAYRRYRKVLAEIEENQELLADPEMKEMAEEELNCLEAEKERLEARYQTASAPQGPQRQTGTLSWRSAPAPAGTSRPSLPATCSGCTPALPRRTAGGWRCISCSESERGGFKEIIASIEGSGCLRQAEV